MATLFLNRHGDVQGSATTAPAAACATLPERNLQTTQQLHTAYIPNQRLRRTLTLKEDYQLPRLSNQSSVIPTSTLHL